MDEFGFEGGVDIQETPDPQDLKQFGASSAVFDASQYAFFGDNVSEEVELGGLEDKEDYYPPVDYDDEEFLFNEEGEVVGSLPEIDDLASTFSKLNKDVSGGSRRTGVIGDRDSRESSSAAEWAQDAEFPNWSDQQILDADSTWEGKRWSLQRLHSSPTQLPESKPLYRASSYPEQQQQHHLHHQLFSSEPIVVQTSSFTSYPPPGGGTQQSSPNYHSHHSNMPYHPGGPQMPLSTANLSTFSNTQFQIGGNLPQYTPPVLSASSRPQNQWINQTKMLPGDRSSILSNLLQPQLPHQNGLMPQQQSQQHRQHPFQPSYGHLSGLQSQLFNPHVSPIPMMMNVADLRDQRPTPMPKGRQNSRYSQQGSEWCSQKSDTGWPQFRSKYMTTDEIESILRLQLVATHSNDPYIDDFYHQACLAKKSAGAKLRHHFCPSQLRDLPPGARANAEPHAYLQVDALGRVAFPSIRRPRPLLEVDPPNTFGAGPTEQKTSEKPLEQEPMLAARVAIEDGLCLLLDVDDIDRFIQFNQLQDIGENHLRRRRQVLLEGLASSLQLVDPLGKNGHTANLVPKDDLIFLRCVSLPKGWKLLSRYLQLLTPTSELLRIVCMAIFRHLRFLFGGVPTDSGAAESTINLSRIVASCVGGMELKALGACLASVVCSSEHPPFRPIGDSAGYGASVILKSVLERATELLTDPSIDGIHGNCSMPNRAFWQASFDAFFGLLTKYCFNKYDTIMQSIILQGLPETAIIGADAARAIISKEMPVELLHASLPHTNEHQRKLLLDFAQRSMPVLESNGHTVGSGDS
ncbi:hypothetical protein Vadar_027557 [Vaccinium darrowii]|uniref:Uncharacterized protein n=1 Tax=Vaccinium darrowii TaxID=229202 RepID=A0ACB7XUG2_9ERIC|nr:hypothetical protein Vadar_027557 [Vaccinium darrowii]